MVSSDCLDCVEVQIENAILSKRKDENTLSLFFVLALAKENRTFVFLGS
jgi:hypothetical protein